MIVLSVHTKGTFCVLLAAILYSIGGLCIKLIPWSGMAINGARTTIALLVISLYLKAIHHKPRINLCIFVGAISICGTNILFSVANKLTTAANAIVLQFTAPVFVILFSVLLFKKQPQKLDLIICALVLGGVILFFVDSLSAEEGMLGNILALLSGISYAGVFLMNDMADGDPISSVFWGIVISALVGLPFLGYETDFSSKTFIVLMVLGVFQVGVAYILLSEGLKTTSPITASLLSGIEPVLSPILVAIFLHEVISLWSLVGAIIVVGSVVLYNILLAWPKH